MALKWKKHFPYYMEAPIQPNPSCFKGLRRFSQRFEIQVKTIYAFYPPFTLGGIFTSTHHTFRRKQYIRLSAEGEAMMSETFNSLESLFLSRLQIASKEDLQDIEQAIDILQIKLFY